MAAESVQTFGGQPDVSAQRADAKRAPRPPGSQTKGHPLGLVDDIPRVNARIVTKASSQRSNDAIDERGAPVGAGEHRLSSAKLDAVDDPRAMAPVKVEQDGHHRSPPALTYSRANSKS